MFYTHTTQGILADSKQNTDYVTRLRVKIWSLNERAAFTRMKYKKISMPKFRVRENEKFGVMRVLSDLSFRIIGVLCVELDEFPDASLDYLLHPPQK